MDKVTTAIAEHDDDDDFNIEQIGKDFLEEIKSEEKAKFKKIEAEIMADQIRSEAREAGLSAADVRDQIMEAVKKSCMNKQYSNLLSFIS